jgi:cation transport ATPase
MLILSWILTAFALTGHILHSWPGQHKAPAAVQFLASPSMQAILTIFCLVGPARGILIDGVKAVVHRRPDMNVLVSLGALSALTVSFVAVGKPSLGWTPFFAESSMLLSVVLLGRSLEERAKLRVCFFAGTVLHTHGPCWLLACG